MATWVSLGGSSLAPHYNIRRGDSYDFEAFQPLTGYADTDFEGTLVYRVGRPSRMAELVGKVIRGYRVTTDLACRAEYVQSAGAVAGVGGITFMGIVLNGVRSGYLPLATDLYPPEGLAFGGVSRTYTLDPPSGAVPSQQRYWEWDTREAEFGPGADDGWIRYSSDAYAAGGEYYPERSLRQDARHTDTTIPIGYMDAAFADITDNNAVWGGYTLEVAPGTVLDNYGARDIRTAHKLRLPAFNVLVSARPSWSASAPEAVGVAMVANTLVEGRAWYPDAADDPLVNLTVVASCDGRFLSVSADGLAFGPSAICKTDATGGYRFYMRGEQAGTVDLVIECGNDTVRGLFNPPFRGVASVKVYGAGGVGGDTGEAEEGAPVESTPVEPPPYQDVETNCLSFPAVSFLPAVPARFDEVVTRAWDAGANSVLELDGDLSLQFDMQKVVGVVIGLVGARGDVTDYERLPHALYFHQTVGGAPLFNVMERGKTLTADATYTPAETAFEIRRTGGTVSYWVNAEKVYTSRTPSAGAVLASTAVFASGDTVPEGTEGGGGEFITSGWFNGDRLEMLCNPGTFADATTLTLVADAPVADDGIPDCGGAYTGVGVWVEGYSIPLDNDAGTWVLTGGGPPGLYVLKLESDTGEVAYFDHFGAPA